MATPTSIQIEDGSVEQRKEYFVKFYDSADNYIGTADDVSFQSFKKTINGGLGQILITLARPFDDFGEGNDIDLANRLELIIVDKESDASGDAVYSGIIDTISPYANKQKEGVDVQAVGYATRLGQVLYQDGATINITQNSTDPSDMVKDVIDRYRASVSNPKINYTTSSVETTSVSASYTFVLKKCIEAIEKARTFAPANWYYYVGADNVLNFKAKPASATHTFTFGKNVASIQVSKNIRDVANQVVLWNGQTGGSAILRSYDDSASQTAYGLRMEKKTDSRWANADTMDLVGQSFINERKDPNIRVIVNIIDSNGNDVGYDIESIEPGDTCKFLNLPDTFTTLGSNLTISSVRYTLGMVTLTLEELSQTLTKKISDVIREEQERQYNNNDLTSYTEV
jgi:hypothetical protein